MASVSSFPPVWGNSFWRVIHVNATRLDMYSTSDAIARGKGETPDPYIAYRKALYDFLVYLPYYLPCAKCEQNFQQFVLEFPLPAMDPPIENAKIFFHWTVDLHNHANQITGKRIVSYDEAEKQYQASYTDNAKLNEYQLARMHDSTKIKALEDELDTLKRSAPPCRDQKSSMIAMGAITAFAVLVAVILLLRAMR